MVLGWDRRIVPDGRTIDVKAFFDQDNEDDFLGIPKALLNELSLRQKSGSLRKRADGNTYFMIDESTEIGFRFVNIDSESAQRVSSTMAVYEAFDKAQNEAAGWNQDTERLTGKLTQIIEKERSNLPEHVQEEIDGLSAIVNKYRIELGLPFYILFQAHCARSAALRSDKADYESHLKWTYNLLDELAKNIIGVKGIYKVKEAMWTECDVILNVKTDSLKAAVARLFDKRFEDQDTGIRSLRFLKVPEGSAYAPKFSRGENWSIENILDNYSGHDKSYRDIARKLSEVVKEKTSTDPFSYKDLAILISLNRGIFPIKDKTVSMYLRELFWISGHGRREIQPETTQRYLNALTSRGFLERKSKHDYVMPAGVAFSIADSYRALKSYYIHEGFFEEFRISALEEQRANYRAQVILKSSL